MTRLRLGINIDHVATLRNARGGDNPCPIRAAQLARDAGADGITAHLREDRRHIRDLDIERLKNEVALPLNLEMAMTEEMLAIALKTKPHAVCLVPEKREELTTEGGLDVVRFEKQLTPFVDRLQQNGSRVSLFIDPDTQQIEAAQRIGAYVVELHMGTYASFSSVIPSAAEGSNATPRASERSLGSARDDIHNAAALAHSLGLEVHAGHGLNYGNVAAIAAIPDIVELNIGHFLIGEAVFTGLKDAIERMRSIMDKART
jgi:pyridoxine 5-phosphate synthase